jgi:hypothetical protein
MKDSHERMADVPTSNSCSLRIIPGRTTMIGDRDGSIIKVELHNNNNCKSSYDIHLRLVEQYGTKIRPPLW